MLKLKFTKTQIRTVRKAEGYFYQQRGKKPSGTIEGYARLSAAIYPFYTMLMDEPWMLKEAEVKMRGYWLLPKPKPITADRYLVKHFSLMIWAYIVSRDIVRERSNAPARPVPPLRSAVQNGEAAKTAANRRNPQRVRNG